MKRYKVTKEQLERVVESFVMESKSRSVVKENDDLDEGLGSWLSNKAGLTDTEEVIASRKEKLMSRIETLKSKGYSEFNYDGQPSDESELLTKMEDNGFSGEIVSIPSRGIMNYKPGRYGASRLGAGGAEKGK